MTRLHARLTGPAAVFLAACAAGPVLAAAPGAGASIRTAGACASAKKGVTIVVDFTKFYRKVDTACDPGQPKNGLDALTGAGFSYTFVPKYPGFVCTIDHLPHPCNGASADAYWSYWHAKRHGKWIFSNEGAGSYKPAPGSVQGWAFGAGKPPRIPPP